MSATITHNGEEFREGIDKIAERFGSAQPALEIIGETVAASVRRNFEKGGRPSGWQALSPATLAKKKGGSTLVGKGFAGGLLGSIHYEADANAVHIGTDKIYGAAHQFGVDETVTQNIGAHTRRIKQAFGKTIEPRDVQVKAHSKSVHMQIPAREFLMIQEEDVEEINAALADFILTGEA